MGKRLSIIVVCSGLMLLLRAAVAQQNPSLELSEGFQPRHDVRPANMPAPTSTASDAATDPGLLPAALAPSSMASNVTTNPAPLPAASAPAVHTDRSAKPTPAKSIEPAEPGAPQRLTAREEVAYINKQPLAFFIAHGGANACGEGCDAWIAAEGFFDQDAADRFRKFLKKPGRRALPIYFHSGGGVVGSALEIGKMMREQHMRAGVGKTVPRECSTSKLSGRACSELAASGREFEAALDESVAICASACVYAFVGASTRSVGPGAVLAIHAARQVIRYSNGRITGGTVVQGFRARVRRYLVAMGIDPALFDASEETSHERFRILTRAEIVRFKIDMRETFETAWNVQTLPSGVASASKALFQKWKAANSDYSEYVERRVVVLCTKRPGAFAFAYIWVPDTQAPEIMGMIKFETGPGRRMALMPAQTQSNGRFNWRMQYVGIERLSDISTLPNIRVLEDGGHGDRQLRLSTAGFSEVLAELTKNCPAR